MTVHSQRAAGPLLPTAPLDDPASRAQRRAWIYLWAGFALWAILVGLGLYHANAWRKTSYTTPTAQLIGKRGIVLYRGPRDSLPVSIAENSELEEGALIELPASSEALIRLRVDNSIVRLRAGAQIRLSTMRVGRFNRDLTQVRLEQLQGVVHYQIAGELPDGREVEVRAPNGDARQAAVKLTKGDYMVWVVPTSTRVTAYVGQAKVETENGVIRLRDGKWLAMGSDRPDMKQAFDLPERLLKNRDFSRGMGEAWSTIDIGEKGRPDVGGTRALVEEQVNGQTIKTLRLRRETAKDTHNETGLRQDVNRDVWAYRSVVFSTWVKVNSASLDGGGYAGSEYPVMIRINYVAENGGSYTWAQGFYAQNPSNRPVDIGQQVTAGAWERFTIDMSKLKDRPAYIASVEILAAGHDFDAQVALPDLAVE